MRIIGLGAAAVAFAVAGCSGGGGGGAEVPLVLNKRPDFVSGPIVSTTYDGQANDLLTGGAGKTGLASDFPPNVLETDPTAEQLRQMAIWTNYRALVDIDAKGGYGTLYGPNVDANGGVTAGEGKIAGEEHLAFADDGSGRENVTLMVQIPATFNVSNACIVTAASSGSRGIYGAIATAGEWGLKKGCAVAYTDKGTGTGAHDVASDAVNLIRGERASPTAAGTRSSFTVDFSKLSVHQYLSFSVTYLLRWGWKHAHSQQNPEQSWGRDTLRAIEFALYMLNEKYGPTMQGGHAATLNAANTLVIASSVGNGGGAALAAAEQDLQGLIDGVAVAAPQVQMNLPASLVIKRGANAVASTARTLYDYFTLAHLYEPCAALAIAAPSASTEFPQFPPGAAANRCAALAANSFVSGATTDQQASDALARMLAAGWEAESVPFIPSQYPEVLPVSVGYTNAYTRSSMTDNMCAYSFGSARTVSASLTPLQTLNIIRAEKQVFGWSDGLGTIGPFSGGYVLNNAFVDTRPVIDMYSSSISTGKQDFNTDGARCVRGMIGDARRFATLLQSIEAVKRTGNLRGKPAIIVHGRADALLPANHTSRPYYALNKSVDGASRLVYYEVTNAQHFDAFLEKPGYDTAAVPMQPYFIQAMDLMYNHLKNGAALPASQVVRTTPRGGTPGAAPAITAANVPPIAATPLGSNAITFSNNTLTIPE